MTPVEDLLDRARQDLEAARHLVQGGFPAQAASRAYYAAFHAAEAALLSLGETRSKHAGVVAAFSRLVVREGGLEDWCGRMLRSLFERRNAADYGGAAFSRDEGDVAIADARAVIDAVSEWLAGRSA
jgi:hypothetical protein